MKRSICTILTAALAALTLMAAAINGLAQEKQSRQQEAFEIGLDAYTYLYPLVIMDVTRLQMTNVPADEAEGLQGPMNQFHHFREFPDVDFKTVVRPNFDTLYSILWADLTEGPVIVTVPDSEGHYYLLPMLDMWTDVFAVPGSRTTGTKGGQYAYVPPGWQGQLPQGVTRIDAPTPYCWMIGRTKASPQSYADVHKFQDGLKVAPLSQWGKTPTPVAAKIDPTVDMKTPPLEQVNNMSAKEFFEYAARLMTLHPPHITDFDILSRMERIGIVAGEELDFDRLDPAVRAGLQEAPAAGIKAMQVKVPHIGRQVNGWTVMTTAGVYGGDFLLRGTIAMIGLGANKPEDAVYPLILTDSQDRPPTAEYNYVIHFEKDDLPPVYGFWSLTMYDAEGFPVANPINRYAIGDRDALEFNADGSLNIYIQADRPDKDRESNWLPSPKQGPLGLTMRLYAPQRQVLSGSWTPPPLKRVERPF